MDEGLSWGESEAWLLAVPTAPGVKAELGYDPTFGSLYAVVADELAPGFSRIRWSCGLDEGGIFSRAELAAALAGYGGSDVDWSVAASVLGCAAA